MQERGVGARRPGAYKQVRDGPSTATTPLLTPTATVRFLWASGGDIFARARRRCAQARSVHQVRDGLSTPATPLFAPNLTPTATAKFLWASDAAIVKIAASDAHKKRGLQLRGSYNFSYSRRRYGGITGITRVTPWLQSQTG